jgi:hypothetical protein
MSHFLQSNQEGPHQDYKESKKVNYYQNQVHKAI